VSAKFDGGKVELCDGRKRRRRGGLGWQRRRDAVRTARRGWSEGDVVVRVLRRGDGLEIAREVGSVLAVDGGDEGLEKVEDEEGLFGSPAVGDGKAGGGVKKKRVLHEKTRSYADLALGDFLRGLVAGG
jgi:hypothetical protein